MKKFTPLILGMVLAGCAGQEPQEIITCPTPRPSDPRRDVAFDRQLAVGLRLPETSFTTGQRIPISVVVYNHADAPINIEAGPGAPYRLRLWRYTGVGWDCIKEYPLTSTIVSRPWMLRARRARVFRPELVVEPDWPTFELLKLQAHVNGREDLAPAVCIEVLPPEKLENAPGPPTIRKACPQPAAPNPIEKKAPAPKPKPNDLKDVM